MVVKNKRQLGKKSKNNVAKIGVKKLRVVKKKVVKKKGARKSKANKRVRLVKKLERAAKKKGFSLFSWIRRGRLSRVEKPISLPVKEVKPLSKEDIAKTNEEIIQKARREPIIVVSPKFAYNAGVDKSVNPVSVPNTREEIKKEIAKSNEFDAKKVLNETQLKNPLLRTDFDNILRMINDEGAINSAIIQLRLGLSQSRLKECYKTLEAAGKIRVDYPLFGQPKLISIEFEKEKKRRDLAKRGILPEIEDDTEN